MNRSRIYQYGRNQQQKSGHVPVLARPKRFRWVIPGILLGILSACIAAVLLISMLRKPPPPDIESCRKALVKAGQSQAEQYAAQQYKAADSAWNRLLILWKTENRAWFFLRDYKNVQECAQQTIRLAEKAYQRALVVRDSLSGLAFTDLNPVKDKIRSYKSRFGKFPLPKSIRDKVAACELNVSESRSAYKRKDFQKAVDRITPAQELIAEAEKSALSAIQEYFTGLEKWRGWERETIEKSRKSGEWALVIDKVAHTCFAYKAGQLKQEWKVELGPNWMGHKKIRGDEATPEGRYRITEKKARGLSKYYKAVVIDYPGKEDQQQFELDKKNGRISKSAEPGGPIEIHGNGGKGADWTNGCIALKDAEMDKLFEIASKGTPVTIVGSLKDFTDK